MANRGARSVRKESRKPHRNFRTAGQASLDIRKIACIFPENKRNISPYGLLCHKYIRVFLRTCEFPHKSWWIMSPINVVPKKTCGNNSRLRSKERSLVSLRSSFKRRWKALNQVATWLPERSVENPTWKKTTQFPRYIEIWHWNIATLLPPLLPWKYQKWQQMNCFFF